LDNSVGVATGYGLDRLSSIPSTTRFSLLHSVQTGTGAHPASYPTGTRSSFPGVKRQGVKLVTHLHLVLRSWKLELYLHSPIFLHGIVLNCRSRWPRGLRHELSSLTRKLGSWVRVQLKAWMSVCMRLFCVCVVLCVVSGLETG
jgi:hypothetical protein